MNKLKQGLCFDDVLLEPQYSKIKRRHEIDIGNKLSENIELSSSLIQPVKEIKTVGEFKVILNLHSEIESFIKIKVVPEELIK